MSNPFGKLVPLMHYRGDDPALQFPPFFAQQPQPAQYPGAPGFSTDQAQPAFQPPQTQAELRSYIANSLAGQPRETRMPGFLGQAQRQYIEPANPDRYQQGLNLAQYNAPSTQPNTVEQSYNVQPRAAEIGPRQEQRGTLINAYNAVAGGAEPGSDRSRIASLISGINSPLPVNAYTLNPLTAVGTQVEAALRAGPQPGYAPTGYEAVAQGRGRGRGISARQAARVAPEANVPPPPIGSNMPPGAPLPIERTGMGVQVSSEPLAQGRISQRAPWSEKPGIAGSGKTQNLLLNTDTILNDPLKTRQLGDVLNTRQLTITPKGKESYTVDPYPNLTRQQMEMNPAERATSLRTHMTDNLLALWDLMPKEARDRAAQWYIGANRIANERAQQYGIHPYGAAGTFAALSPQKDWFQNVYLGDQVLDIMNRDPRFTTEMRDLAPNIGPYKKPGVPEAVRGFESKTLSQIQDPTMAAAFLRLYDEAHSPRNYRIIRPEGDYGDMALNADGTPAKAAWSSFSTIRKAMEAAQSGGDPGVLSDLMGSGHKVRNFYNNIVAPIFGQRFGDITSDTHQVAAGLFRPLTGNSQEVIQAMNTGGDPGSKRPPESAATGLSGTYPLYADATRLAAEQRDVPVRAMQSVPWEAIRSLFPPEFRTASNMQMIDNIWRGYGNGEISADQARAMIIARAGGFKAPTW